MKFFRFLLRFIVSIVIASILICLGLWLSGNIHLIKAVRSTYLVGKTGPTIDDYPKFINRRVEAGKHTPWSKRSKFKNKIINKETLAKIEQWETSALFILEGGKVAYEHYWDDYSEESLTNSFSVAKSFTALCIGKAIEEGFIQSLDQKVADFIPEFQTDEKAKITLRHLLSMSSGIDFGESYGDPFGFMAKAYYGTDLYDLTVNKAVKDRAGEIWKYQGGNTLLLSFVIKEATGLSLSNYFSNKFWKPLGASQDALWSLNKEGGLERSYCCFYSNASDYARIGQMILDSGQWDGKQIIATRFLEESFQAVMLPSEANKNIDYYGLHWWLGDYQGVEFKYARGIQGQYIVVIPDWDMVIVRLGHKRDPEKGVRIPKDLFVYLEAGKEITERD